MQNGPIDATAWELEAARRRELVEAEFGATRELRHDSEPGQRDAHPIRSFASWVAATLRRDQGTPAAGADRTPTCQPGVTAIKTGS